MRPRLRATGSRSMNAAANRVAPGARGPCGAARGNAEIRGRTRQLGQQRQLGPRPEVVFAQSFSTSCAPAGTSTPRCPGCRVRRRSSRRSVEGDDERPVPRQSVVHVMQHVDAQHQPGGRMRPAGQRCRRPRSAHPGVRGRRCQSAIRPSRDRRRRKYPKESGRQFGQARQEPARPTSQLDHRHTLNGAAAAAAPSRAGGPRASRPALAAS